MSTPTYRFRASDALVYADTFRRLRLESARDISNGIERVRERMFEMNSPPPRLYAELRAHEHALAFVLKREEPGMVILGESEPDEESEEGALAREMARQAEQRRELESEVERLRGQLRQARQQADELEGRLVQSQQAQASLRRRLSQAHANTAVLGVAAAAIILALLFIAVL